MPRLSLGLGVQAVRKVGRGAPPSGLAVATTNAVNISGNNFFVPTGTYTKVTTIGSRVAGSIISEQAYLSSGLVYLNQAGFNPIDYPFHAYGYILIPPNTVFTATADFDAGPMTSSVWRAGIVLDENSDGYLYFGFRVLSENSSTNSNYIPTSGWFPSITITAT